MKGSMKQITWANEIITKLETVNNTTTDAKSKFLLNTVIKCCKREDTYAGDVIELFAQAAREADNAVAKVAARYMQSYDNDLRNTIYAEAKRK